MKEYSIDIEILDLAIAICDSSGYLVHCNSSFRNLFDVEITNGEHSLTEFLGEMARPIIDIINSGKITHNKQSIELADSIVCKIRSIDSQNNSQILLTFLDCKEICVNQAENEALLRAKVILDRNTLFLETLLDSIQFPIYYKNWAGEYTIYNKEFKHYFLGDKIPFGNSFTIEDLTDIYDPKDIIKTKSKDLEFYNSDETKQIVDISINCCDGVSRDFILSKSKLIDYDGNTQGIVGIMMDTTLLRSLATMLEDTQKRYLHLFQSSIDGIFYIDVDGYILDANPAFVYIVSQDHQNIIKKNFLELIDNKYDDDLEHILNSDELKVYQKNGNQRIISTNIWEDFDDNLALVGYWGIVRDITQEKIVQNMLVESQLRYDLAVKGSSDGLWDWDIASGNVWRSPRYLELVGHKASSIATVERMLDKIHRDDVENVKKLLNSSLKNNEPFRTEFRILTGNGSYEWFMSRGVVSFDLDQKPVRMAGSLQSIQEQKASAAREQKYILELRRSNEELQQFAYIASHDLQEPLRMISSFLQLIKNRYADKLDSSAHEFIGFAVEGSVRLQAMINDLLAYSRVQSQGKDFGIFDANLILNRAILLISELINENSAIINSDDLPKKLYCDDLQLIQLFMNLLTNAIKFTKKDISPEINISCNELDDHYQFSIADNGIGIEEKYFDRIFHIFQKLHPRDEFSGTGIGLAICQKIAANHNGSISVQSKSGLGSKFIFTIHKAIGRQIDE